MGFGSLGWRITLHKEKMAIERDRNVGKWRLEYGIWAGVLKVIPPPLSRHSYCLLLPREPTFERSGFNQNFMKEMPVHNFTLEALFFKICSQNFRKSQTSLLSIRKIGPKWKKKCAWLVQRQNINLHRQVTGLERKQSRVFHHVRIVTSDCELHRSEMIRNVLFLTIDYDLGEYHPGVLYIMELKSV